MSRLSLAGLTSLALLAACAHHEPGAPSGATASGEAAPKPEPLPQPAAAEPVAARPFPQAAPLQTLLTLDPKRPIVTFKVAFRAGSVDDPPGKEGLTALTAALMAQGGTQSLSTSQLLDALFPMAAELSVDPDKELTTFDARVHKDHLERFLAIFADVITHPRFDPKELERLRTDALNALRTGLRGEDDEALGKAGLDALLFSGHPYAHPVEGTVQGLKSITLQDVQSQWKRVFTQDRLILGLGGPVDDALAQTLKQRLSALPVKGAPLAALPPAPPVAGRVLILKKPNASTAISMGYAYSLRRGDPDYVPVAFALSALGEHRQSMGTLYQQLRDIRGLNYGDYAYAEHAEGGYPSINVPRSTQDFSIWLRPVEPGNAIFAARAAQYFLSQLVENGITEEQFKDTQGFLLGYSRLLDQTDEQRLGFAVDSLLYGTPHFLDSFRDAVARLTPAEVQAAVRRRLHPDRMNFVFVAQDAEKLAVLLREQPPTPMEYETPKGPDVMAADRAISALRLPIDPEQIRIEDAQGFMER